MDDMQKQAKKKALRLLEQMDRTEEELRLKLRQKGFTEQATEAAIDYVKSFRYIDDVSYAERFVQSRQKQKSRKEIYMTLCQKGIEREIIEHALELCYAEYSEVDTIQNILDKKRVSVSECSTADKQKFYNYLARRGFKSEDIRQVIQVSLWNA